MSALDFRVLDDASAQELSERLADVFRTRHSARWSWHSSSGDPNALTVDP